MGSIKKKRVFLIISGILFALILLESGLRLGGFVYLSIQESKNQRTMQEKDTYRILCLGESTTAGEWPPFLDKILNQKNIGSSFSVMDKGLAGTNTTRILAELEENIDKYKPDLVVTMMGVNDGGCYREISNIRPGTLKNLKVYKLFKMILLSIKAKNQEVQAASIDSVKEEENILEITHEEELEKNKKNNFLSADKVYVKLQENKFVDDNEYVLMGENYRDQYQYEQAIKYFKKALEINPENDQIYRELGYCYRNQNKHDISKKYFQKALEINPNDAWNHIALAYYYTDSGQPEQAKICFETALKINPEHKRANAGLGRLCREQGRYEEAVRYLQKAITINPENEMFYDQLGLCFRSLGKHKEAESAFEKSRKLIQKQGCRYYSSNTINNYIKLKKILDEKNIQYVCVQYPMWDVELLKDIFKEESGIIFVDNKKTFETAIRRSSYGEYFVDTFGGEFGHCTDKGNRLLAENIA
ncbi:MAG: tetratricopeptide repeat protein, partial [Elusimicrobia bacterium]|nr:tetratricopeptide repeat protein [Elusimicrobiota bacterium]